MKKIFFVLILSLFLKSGVAQITNLVPNGDFEFYTSCPDMLGQIDSAYPWSQPNLLGSSSDYLNSCNSFVYPNFFSDYPPHSGNGFASILPSDYYTTIDYREYISNKLKITLVQNRKYCTKYFVKAAKTNNVFIDAFGIYFSTYFIIQSSLMSPLLYTAQINNKKENILDNINNWMKISGSFISQGGEQFITIGNFEKQDSVKRLYVGTNPTSCTYFIDDVSVCDCEDFEPKLGRDTTLCTGQQLLLKAHIPKEADSVIYTWQDGSKDSVFLVNQSGTYCVSAYIEDYKITVTDTIRVNYTDCTPPEYPLWIPNSFTPNGDGLNDVFKPETLAELEEYTMLIFNRWGQQIFESNDINKAWDGKYKGKAVPLGVYTYHIEATDKLTKEKKVYNGRVTLVMN